MIRNLRLVKSIILFFVIVFFGLASAQNTISVAINSSSIDNVISVSIPVLPEKLLPFYEYRSHVEIDWAIPNSSLANMVSDEVKVYVKAVIRQLENESSSVYFKDGNIKFNVSYAVLTCFLQNSTCSNDSVLQNNMTFFVYLSGQQNISATIYFFASLSPFEEFLPIYEESIVLRTELDRLSSNLNIFNSSLNDSVNNLIKESNDQLSTFRLEEVKSNIKEIRRLTGREDLFFQLSSAFNDVLSSLRSLFDSISSNAFYSIAFFLALIVFISAFFFKIKKDSKIVIIFVSTVVMILSVLKVAPAELLIFVDAVALLFVFSILLTRKFFGKKEYELRSSRQKRDSNY